MTSQDDPFAAQRVQLLTALKAAVAASHYSHAAMVAQQINAIEAADSVLLPGLVCIKAAEALGGHSISALGAATALSLLNAMGRVYDDITSEGSAGLEVKWGMPRTLNALDAFYAVAQTSFIEASESLPPEARLAALAAYDDLCHRTSLALGSTTGSPVSIEDAALIAGIVAGAKAAEPSSAVTAVLAEARSL